ncbi:MAG: nitrilase-related carbon-nitrogen hydrolase [Mycobacteriales bacterium]
MRVALAQVNCVLGDVEANLRTAKEAIGRAASERADLVVFPELTLHGYPLGRYDASLALPADDPRLRDLAQPLGPAVVIGFHEDAGPHSYNSVGYFVDHQLVHVHRKLYLPTYDVWEEHKHFSPGHALRAFPTPLGRMGILTCNDAWQACPPFILAQDGAEVLLVPTNSVDTRAPDVLDTHAYWRDLLRAVARMNELWVVFVNRVGHIGELEFWGGSAVVDPAGEVILSGPVKEEALVVVEIEVAAARRRRRQLPLLKDARLGLLVRELERLIAEGGNA